MISSYANKLIKEYAETMKAMQKVIANSEGRERLACIWIKRKSHIAQATDGHVFAVLDIEALDKELDALDIDEAYNMLAFHAGYKALGYMNGYAFVTSKMHDQFVNAIDKPINDAAEWMSFDYPDLKKLLPESGALKQSNQNESIVDAKILCILNNIRKTHEFAKHEKQIEIALWGENDRSVQIASYTGLLLGVVPILRDETENESFNEASYGEILNLLN